MTDIELLEKHIIAKIPERGFIIFTCSPSTVKRLDELLRKFGPVFAVRGIAVALVDDDTTCYQVPGTCKLLGIRPGYPVES